MSPKGSFSPFNGDRVLIAQLGGRLFWGESELAVPLLCSDYAQDRHRGGGCAFFPLRRVGRSVCGGGASQHRPARKGREKALYHPHAAPEGRRIGTADAAGAAVRGGRGLCGERMEDLGLPPAAREEVRGICFRRAGRRLYHRFPRKGAVHGSRRASGCASCTARTGRGTSRTKICGRRGTRSRRPGTASSRSSGTAAPTTAGCARMRCCKSTGLPAAAITISITASSPRTATKSFSTVFPCPSVR